MELMDHYLEAGGNVIDTAESYACWLPGGEYQSEKVIGEWFRERGTRDQIVQIDLYWLHRDSPGYPVEEILESLEAFRQAGKIKHAGFSNWTQSRAEEARLAAERLGMQGFVASQNMWSLAKPDVSQADSSWAFIDESFVRWHIVHGLSAFAYLAQANGYFRRLEQNALDKVPADARVRILFDHQENRDRFQRIRRLQQEYRFSVGQIVIGYLISQPLPVFALVGPKTLTDLKDCIACADTKLSKEDIHYLEHGEVERT